VAASQGNNGYGWQVGGCPNCLVMPIRASSGLLYDFGNLAAAIRYAREMGASVISHAGANFTWSRLGQQEAVERLQRRRGDHRRHQRRDELPPLDALFRRGAWP
jgi:hypothetical protein